MKINELVERINEKDFALEKELEVKKYVPVMDKKSFVMDVIAACTDEIDGFISADRFNMDIYFNMNMIRTYTNIEVAFDFDEMVEQYDMLCECGLLDKIIGLFESEYIAMCDILDGQLEELFIQNSLEAQIVKIANKINNTIDMLSAIDIKSLLPDGVSADMFSNIANMLK